MTGKPETTYGGSSEEFQQDDPNMYMGVPKSELMNTPEDGLSETEASHRLTRFGYNKLREKERNIGQRVLLLSWAPSNVLSSVSVGYRANSRDTAVTFRNSVTRSCTYPKGTKSSSTP